MAAKTTIKFSCKMRERVVRLVLDHACEYQSRCQAIPLAPAKIGCSGHSLSA